jgi:formamidopyrimidine-DNA glycosylase
MPELPDVTVYCEALGARIAGQVLMRVDVVHPFLLRTAVPPISAVEGCRVIGVRRLGKRIAIELDGGLFLVIHLMIAGRLRWLAEGDKVPARITLAVLHFVSGRLAVTEAGTRRRASMHVVEGEEALASLNAQGLEIADIDEATFASRLVADNRTLKRALTDPRTFSGIGNAYSDEILHRARLSPIAHTQKLSREDVARLYHATRDVLDEWTRRLRDQAGAGFPVKVTAFRPEMAVHGRYGKPCPVCGAPVQRIVYAENECNYCARCQTGGKVLADRALSRLLHESWPRSIDALE